MSSAIWFGDGSYATLIGMKDVSSNDKHYKIITFKVDPYFSKKFDLSKFNNKDSIRFFKNDIFKCFYPTNNVTPLREDPDNYVYFVENNMDGTDSTFSNRHETFKRIIKSQKEIINTLKENINQLDNDKRDAENKAANDFTQTVNRVREVLLVTGQNRYTDEVESDGE
jgi:hypothetical protein